jgi:ankyrin repeat protein
MSSSALFRAASKGDAILCEKLVTSSSVHSSASSSGVTPFFLACANGHLDAAMVLHRAGSNVLHKNNNGTSCLAIACIHGHEHIVDMLLRVPGVSVNHEDNEGWTPFHRACHENHLPIMRRLVDAGARTYTKVRSVWTPLHSACSKGWVDCASFLLDCLHPLDDHSPAFGTPLQYACAHGHVRIAEMLIKRGADTTIVHGDSGDSCLHFALYSRSEEMIQCMIRHVPSHVYSKHHRPPLHIAIDLNLNGAIESLLSQEHAVDEHGNTVVHMAVKRGRVDLLRRVGSRSMTANKYGNTPLHFVSHAEQAKQDMVDFFEPTPDQWLIRNASDQTALWLLMKQGLRVRAAFECTVCLEQSADIVLPSCSHVLCRACFHAYRKRSHGPLPCPTCRRVMGDTACSRAHSP